MRKYIGAIMKIKKEYQIFALLFLLSVSALAYQNCSQGAAFPANSLNTLASGSQLTYDTELDQIAYMSCPGLGQGQFDQSAYFTFRAGAYNTGSGVFLSSNYLANKSITARALADQAGIINQTPANATARLQLAVRQFSNFQNILLGQSGSTTGTDGVDYTTFFQSLDDQDLATAILSIPNNADGLRYARNESAAGQRVETSIFFNTSPAIANSIRQNLQNNSAILGLTYQDTTGGFAARSPSEFGFGTLTPDVSVYGRGYQITFRQPSIPPVVVSGEFPAKVLGTVTEFDMQSRGSTVAAGTWTCDPAMQFMILRSNLTEDIALVQQATGTACQIGNDPSPMSPQLAIVRNSFRAEDWYIDMTHHCMIPKKPTTSAGSCYGGNTLLSTDTQIINARQTGQGLQDYLDYNLSESKCYDIGSNANVCVDFGSVCYRQ